MIWADGYCRFPQVRFGRLFSPLTRPVPDGAEMVTAYTDGRVTLRSNRRRDGYHEALDMSAHQGVKPGDLVVHGLDILRGSVGVSDAGGAISSVCIVCSPRVEVDPRYFAYAIRAESFSGLPRAWARGVREGGADFRRWDTLASLPVPLPCPASQSTIADYLDRETARIDAIIMKKRRFIDLVQERALARVYAGIRDVKASGARKFSGLSWLDDIPESWLVMPVGWQFEVLLGKMLDQNRVTGEHLKPYLRNINVQWDRIDIDDLLVMNFPPQECLRYRVLPGDLLVCEGGEPGRAALWDGKVTEIYYQKALHRVRARGHSTARWLFYCLRAAVALNVFAVEGNTTTIAHLTGEQLRAHRFPFPDRLTQERLVAELDKHAARDDRLLELTRVQIDRLNEHRQALITAAVTGQIKLPVAA